MTYSEFIQNIIDTRGQWGIPDDEYFECHHIVPKCMGGQPKNISNKIRFSNHKNLIRLYPDEHFMAHELLYLENPENFLLFSAFKITSMDKQISAEQYKLLKEGRKDLPSFLRDIIDEQGEFRYKSRKQVERKTGRDTTQYQKEQQRRKVLGISCKGERNGMFGNGEKVSGGKNGHASIRYFYKDKRFECRKDLIEYLHEHGIAITSSAIRKVVHNTGTLRVYCMYKDVFDNLRWEYKNED